MREADKGSRQRGNVYVYSSTQKTVVEQLLSSRHCVGWPSQTGPVFMRLREHRHQSCYDKTVQ